MIVDGSWTVRTRWCDYKEKEFNPCVHQCHNIDMDDRNADSVRDSDQIEPGWYGLTWNLVLRQLSHKKQARLDVIHG